jgi:hypothetical protein
MFHSVPVLPDLFWTFQIAYFKPKLRSSDDKASPCFRQFWIENVSDRVLPIRLWVWFKHILISLANFIAIPNSMGILYNTSLLNESRAFSKSVNNWCTVPLRSHFSLLYNECRESDQLVWNYTKYWLHQW